MFLAARIAWITAWLAALFGGVPVYEAGPLLLAASGIIIIAETSYDLFGGLTPSGEGATQNQMQEAADGQTNVTVEVSVIEMFEAWGNKMLGQDINGLLSASEAYKNYSDACRINGETPESDKKFFTWLTNRAKQNYPAVKKEKTNGGKIHYRGWRLVGEGG